MERKDQMKRAFEMYLFRKMNGGRLLYMKRVKSSKEEREEGRKKEKKGLPTKAISI